MRGSQLVQHFDILNYSQDSTLKKHEILSQTAIDESSYFLSDADQELLHVVAFKESVDFVQQRR